MASEEVVPEAGFADPRVVQFGEDDAWYRTILDFVQVGAEGDAMDPPDFLQAHIPHDEIHVSGPRRDASSIEFATASLASRGYVIYFLLNFLPINLIILLV